MRPLELAGWLLLLAAARAGAQEVPRAEGAADPLDPPAEERAPVRDAIDPRAPLSAVDDDAEAPGRDDDGDDDGWPRLSGSVGATGGARTSPHESDQDAWSYLSTTLELSPTLEVYFKGDLSASLARDGSDAELLIDLRDAWDHDVQGRVQEAYVRLHDVGGLELTLGRQRTWRAESLHFDGASASFTLGVVTLRGLGGVPVYPYKSAWRGDVLAGAGLDLRPSAWTLLSVDYLHVTEVAGRDEVAHDDLLTASLRQTLGGWVTVLARGDLLEDRPRSAEVTLTIAPPGWDLRLRARAHEGFRAQAERTLDLDPFSAVLGPENPYRAVEVSLWKGLFDVLGLELSVGARDVTKDADEGLWNQDFRRASVTLQVHDLPVEGVTLTLTGEAWRVDGARTRDRRQAGGELEWRASDWLRLAAGSSYLLYRWDALADRDRADVRLLYGRVELRGGGHRLDARYELEQADGMGDVHVVRVGYRRDF